MVLCMFVVMVVVAVAVRCFESMYVSYYANCFDACLVKLMLLREALCGSMRCEGGQTDCKQPIGHQSIP